jgi:D-lactate dehydrogenase
MKVAVFNTKPYDQKFLAAAAEGRHQLTFFEPRLSSQTAELARGFPVVCVFVHDDVGADALQQLAKGGTRLVALRCAGFNNVDVPAAEKNGIHVVRVPAYSPHAVAEHAVGLMMALNRQLPRAFNRVREGNFALNGLLGFDMHGKTAGVVGTGKIGIEVAKILHGFGCRLLAHDVREAPECVANDVKYVPIDKLLAESDIISLHCPLLPSTQHLIDERAIALMKPGVMLINTSRGGLVDTQAVIHGLKSGRIGYLGLDVYEEEEELFFEDMSSRIIHDDVFTRLLTFPNVLITGHQAFFTSNALEAIARVTIDNISAFERGEPLANAVVVERAKA